MSKIEFSMSRRFGMAGLLGFAILAFSAPTLDAQDLSDDITNPTQFAIGASSVTQTIANSVFESDLSTGVTGNTTGDTDFFNINVEQGFQLDSITLNSFTGGSQAFFGFAENSLGGNSALSSEQNDFIATASGFTLIDGSENSLFSELVAGAQGELPGNAFDPNQPLDAGTYAFVFQNTGGNINEYSLTFTGSAVTSAIPEPSSALAITCLGLAFFTRRRR